MKIYVKIFEEEEKSDISIKEAKIEAKRYCVADKKPTCTLKVLAVRNNKPFIAYRKLSIYDYKLFYSPFEGTDYYDNGGYIEDIAPTRSSEIIKNENYKAMLTYNELNKLFLDATRLLGFDGSTLNLLQGHEYIADDYKKSD